MFGGRFLSTTRQFNDLTKDRSGNFATITALAMVPLLSGVAMLLDYSNVTRENTRLQNAVDSSVLMAGAYYRDNGKLPADDKAKRFLELNGFTDAELVTMKVVDGEVYLRASVRTDVLFMDVLHSGGYKTYAEATVPVSIDREIEIALVLDTTSSMSLDDRLVDMKQIATNFVDDALDMAPPGNSDAVTLSIVPFAKYVNVGIANRNASWIDVPPDSTQTVCSMKRDIVSQSGCVERTEERIGEMGPYTARWQQCDTTEYGPEYEVCTPQTQVWNGCVGSRAAPLNVEDHSYGTDPVLGVLNVNCPSAIQPLTSVRSVLANQIRDLTATGETYIGQGVACGTRTLSPAQPFAGGDPDLDKTIKSMIIMTDGDNRRSPNTWDEGIKHDNGDVANGDYHTQEACDYARLKGIEVYTISFGDDVSSGGDAVMLACAGDASRFFKAEDERELRESFEAILSNIFTLRLTS
ncbi:MAG: pilus assembly protein [Pseudomonadota bacterium]